MKASADATRIYFEEHKSVQHKPLADTGIQISAAGFGAYRIDNSSEEYKEALRFALKQGVNLIDTSTNYSNGDSEKCIGNVLYDCMSRGVLSREQAVVVSKAGYIQGDLYEESQQRKQQGTGFKDLVEYDDGLEHCIHPEFLAEQIGNSLERLQLECIDVYLLHNPEYFKYHAQKQGFSPEETNNAYYARIEEAFEYLEEEVLAGRIQYYGVSSNTFAYHPTHPDATALSKLLDIVQKRAFKHFKVIQCPLNIFEYQALQQSDGHSCIELAQEHNIAVLTNRPLNAIVNHRLYRLAEVEDQDEIALIEIDDCLEEGSLHEASLREKFKELELPDTTLNYFQIFYLLRDHFNDDLNYFDFKNMIASSYYPLLTQLIHYMSEQPFELEVTELFEEYTRNANIALRNILNYLANKQNSKMSDLKHHIYSKCPELATCFRFSNLMLRMYRSRQGVSSVLVGMRSQEYAKSVVEELKEPCDQPIDSLWDSVQDFQHVIY